MVVTNEVQIYRSDDGETHASVRFEKDTAWLMQRQMGDIFGSTPENILMRMKNIYQNQELTEPSTTKKFLVVQTGGKRQVERNLQHYNLDAIISVGYRFNSKQGVQFRIWATRHLREYLTQGYSIDSKCFDQNADELKCSGIVNLAA